LLPESQGAGAARRLAEDVRRFKHLTTGFLGAPLICPVLGNNGYWDEAFMLLNRKEYPSWLYPITRGATTIWERWDGIKEDGSFQDKEMNSFNHYAYGAIGEWLYKVVAGIELDTERPGYKHIKIQPHPGGGLQYARAALESPYGRIVSDWQIRDNRFTLTVEIPANSTATVRLPGASEGSLRGSATGPGILWLKSVTGAVLVEIGSGKYVFTYPML
jgi:alpha-L-rhamnosidase